MLLDTHVWLWLLTEPERLPEPVGTQVLAAQEIRLSAASVWEAGIKHGLGKLPLPVGLSVLVLTSYQQSGVVGLPVTAEHALAVAALPPLHRDPFDRLLVAQALHEGLTLVTADRVLQRYAAPVLFVGP